MSTIQSSAEHLTLNADGSSKDIKLQSNASEKVIIKSDGKVGIGTSSPSAVLETKNTTDGSTFAFQATNDNDHEIVQIGAQSDGDGYLTVHGQGAATNIKALIHSDGNSYFNGGNLGIGTASPSAQLHLKQTSGDQFLKMEGATTNWGWRNQSDGTHGLYDFTNSRWLYLGNNSYWSVQTGGSEKFKITSGGRVVSQSNAHSWVNYNQVAPAVQDSYNVSSVTDVSSGYFKVNFDVDHGNGSYAVCGMAGNHRRVTQDGAGLNTGYVAIYTQLGGSTTPTDETRVFVITFGD